MTRLLVSALLVACSIALVACEDSKEAVAPGETAVGTPRPPSTVSAEPSPTATVVPLDPDVDARLDEFQIQPQDVAPDATLVTEENLNLAIAANLFAGDPEASANLTKWGFRGARAWTFRAGNTNIVVTVQAYASAIGAADAFSDFADSIARIPATLQSNDEVSVRDAQSSTFQLPPLGDEAYGTFSSVRLESKATGVVAVLESRAIVFRGGDTIVSITSFPALAEPQMITAAQTLAGRV